MDVHTIITSTGGTGGTFFSRFRRRSTYSDKVFFYLLVKEKQPQVLLVDKKDDLFSQRFKELIDKLYFKLRKKEERSVKIPHYLFMPGRKVKENTAIKENALSLNEKFKLLFRLHKKKVFFAKYNILRKKLFQKLNIQKLAAFLDKQLSGLIVMQKIKLQSRQPVPLILS